MATSEASRSREQLLRQVTEARGAPVTATGTGDVVAMAVSPRHALGDADAEWTMLARAGLAMEAPDWPASIVPHPPASLPPPAPEGDLVPQLCLPAERIVPEILNKQSG